MRIASLLASGTETVFALGLGEQLVAISHECDFPPEALSRPRISRPRFDPDGMTSGEVDRSVRRALAEHGSVYELDEIVLREVKPDLLLTQAVCEVCAVSTTLALRAAELLEERPHVLSLDSHTVEDIFEGILAIGRTAGVGERARDLVASLRDRFAAVRAGVAGGPVRRLLAIEWLDPPFVPGHWVPEMVECAGGTLVGGAAGVASRQVTWDDLGGHDPDVLVVMPCGYGLASARAEADRHRVLLHDVAGRAVRSGHSFVVDGSSYFNRSGPRVADGVEILGALLHSDRLASVDLSGRAEAWT